MHKDFKYHDSYIYIYVYIYCMRALHGMLLVIENLAHGTHGTDMLTVLRGGSTYDMKT